MNPRPLILTALLLAAPRLLPQGARLAGSFPPPGKTARLGGWILLQVQGPPRERGIQQGRALGPYMARQIAGMKIQIERETGKDWDFFKKAALRIFGPRVPAGIRKEMEGIVAGAAGRGVRVDYGDVLLWNGWIELVDDWFPAWRRRHRLKGPRPPRHGGCSAFLAAGSWTSDGRIVAGHNTWSLMSLPNHCNVILKVVPKKGLSFVMQTFPGGVHSNTDFYINSAGLIVTETTIAGYTGEFRENLLPEFVRIRLAVQFARSIDEFARTMIEANNGGYANTWLVGDTKTGEIARLELGFMHHPLTRTKDGFLGSSNLALDPDLLRDETRDRGGPRSSNRARMARWKQLASLWKGRITVAAGRLFLSDHYDTFQKRYHPSTRTLCGHFDSTRWKVPFGAMDALVTDSVLARDLRAWGRWGRPCGMDFHPKDLLRPGSRWSWLKGWLPDLPGRPWVLLGAEAMEQGKENGK